jgi:hypothetical protein
MMKVEVRDSEHKKIVETLIRFNCKEVIIMQSKNFDNPDEVRTPSEKTTIEVIKLGDKEVMRATFAPGWQWSNDVKPTAGTESCQVHHRGLQTSGRMHVKMADGTEAETGPDDVTDIPPGHDAWVVGDEPVVIIDFGASGYGK